MDNIATTIVLGVFSGILTSGILFLLNRLFWLIILPWYQQLVYEGVDLDDIWIFEQSKDEGTGKFRLKLNQNAHNLSGQLTYTRIKENEEKEIVYSVIGSVWEGYLTLNMKSIDRKSIAFATALLKIGRGGRELQGAYCYRNFRSDLVNSLDLKFVRQTSF